MSSLAILAFHKLQSLQNKRKNGAILAGLQRRDNEIDQPEALEIRVKCFPIYRGSVRMSSEIERDRN